MHGSAVHWRLLASCAALIGGCTIGSINAPVNIPIKAGDIQGVPGPTSNAQLAAPGTPNQPNRAPVVAAFTANPTQLTTPGGTVTFNIEAADPDGDLISYSWTATGGTLSTTAGKIVSWQAPKDPGVYTVQVALNDGKGGISTASTNITVNVSGVGNVEPTPAASSTVSSTPSPSPTPESSPTPTPVPTVTANPLGNDALDGFGDGKLNSPNAITISGGEVYVTDLDTSLIAEGRVQVFGSDGVWRRTIKYGAVTSGSLPTNLTGVAFSGPTIFLSNSNSTGSLYTYSAGKFSQFGIGSKNNAAALATDSWGSVYVGNTTQSCVSKFTASGDVQSLFFVSGVNPKGLAFDNNNNLYIADGGTNAVRVVDTNGTLLRDIATGMSTIGSMAVEKSSGNVYVVDASRKEVKRFKADGTSIQAFGAGVLADPKGIAIDDSGVIFVIDGQYGAKKIFRFSPGH